MAISWWIYAIALSFPGIIGKDRFHLPGDITLGGLFLLHYSTEDGKCGDFFPIGLGHVEAMIFAIEKINSDPNLLPNVTLGYDIRDYCESAAKAMEHTYDFVRRNELMEEIQNASCTCENGKDRKHDKPTPIAAVIGPTDSGSAVLVASLLQVAGIPLVSHSATSNELSSPQYRHFFRTAPPDGQQASAMADIIQYFNWSYIAAVAMDDSYGRNGVWELESEAEKRKTFCLSFAEYIPRQEYNVKLTRAVGKLKTYPNIRVVVLWLFGGYGRSFLKEAVKQNLFDRTWILSDALATEDDTFVGIKISDQIILHGSLGVQPRYLDNQEFEDFLIKERSMLSAKNVVPWWREFWQSETQDNCSAIASRKKRNDCMERVLRSVYDTYIPYVLDAVYSVANAIHNLENCSLPERKNSGDVCQTYHATIDPKELERFLRLVDFKGLTGQISFDQFGDPVTSSYDIVHFQDSNESSGQRHPVKRVIGSWEKNRKQNLQLNDSMIRWNAKSGQTAPPRSFCHDDCPPGTFLSLTTPCCWECIKCPAGTVSSRVNDVNCTECPLGQMPDQGRSECLDLPEVELLWSSTTSILVILFATIGLFLVGICSFVLYKHRETPLVKAANRELSSILMVTITLSFSVSILSLAKPTDVTCSLVHSWRSTVLVTFISILILKTMKILSAFRINVIAESFKKFILSTKSQTFLVLALIFIPGMFLSFWIALDAPRQERIIQPVEGTILLSCSLHQSSVGMSLQIAISVYTSLLAVVCTFYAFKARTLPENFNEARYIGFSMYILLLSSVAYYPLDIGLKGSYATNLTCAMTLLSSYGLLACLFGPKIYVIIRQPEKNTHEAVSSQVSDYSFNASPKGKKGISPEKTSNQEQMHLECASVSSLTN